MQYNNEHYNAIITKSSSFQQSENARIDRMHIHRKEHNEMTNMKVQLDEQHDINTSISHLISPQDQLYLKKLVYSVTVENPGLDFEQEVLNTQKYPILNLTHDTITNSPKNSPRKNDTHKTLEDIERNDLPGYILINDKFQTEDYYSGDEDAVLYYAAKNEQTPIATSTDDTVDLTKSHQNKTCDSGNINSDSLSSLMSDSSTPLKTCVHPQKYAKGRINEMKFQTIIPEQVDLIPWDIDGDKVYHVKCEEKDYIEQYADGWWFVLHNSSQQGLNGHRKMGLCLGSLICEHPDCSKLATDGVVNTIDFKCKGEDLWECRSCGYSVKKIFCGCQKTIEYHRDKKLLIYQHEGTHICSVKLNVKVHHKALDTLPLPLSGTSKPLQYMKDCMQFHIDNGNINEGFEVSKAVSHSDVLDRIKKL